MASRTSPYLQEKLVLPGCLTVYTKGLPTGKKWLTTQQAYLFATERFSATEVGV